MMMMVVMVMMMMSSMMMVMTPSNMVLLRAERDYKGDMEALSLEIEQVQYLKIFRQQILSEIMSHIKQINGTIFSFLLGCGEEGYSA